MTGPVERSAERPVGAPGGSEQRQRYWRLNLRLTAVLMLLWFLVSFVFTFFARELSFSFFGWPFSYWMGAQGAILVYLAIVAVYAQVMDRLDRAHGVAEDSE
jgi:putative solute:sodium symporter small subunit